MGLTKHVQAYSMSYYTLFNEKTIKKLSCSTYIQNPQKTPFYTLVPLQLSPCPKLCPIMYVVCTKLNYASDWSWWRRWRVWSIYQMRHSQNSQKKPSMACLINLLNNGVNGVDGFDGVNGVFDNLPFKPDPKWHPLQLIASPKKVSSLTFWPFFGEKEGGSAEWLQKRVIRK